jgi:hypothetical protein
LTKIALLTYKIVKPDILSISSDCSRGLNG